ncbi:unnamed protein product [Staurois parvus]|uniref:Uncharacterized protein n=1 Tax=Staurois parvus TaxID=386267 RepID=A0ABN9GLH1_9NEOB|nr:unnamed protein product [Staurois parvus]
MLLDLRFLTSCDLPVYLSCWFQPVSCSLSSLLLSVFCYHLLLTLGLFSTTLLPDPNLKLLLTDLGLFTDHASV